MAISIVVKYGVKPVTGGVFGTDDPCEAVVAKFHAIS